MSGVADFRGIAIINPVTGKWGSASRNLFTTLYSQDFVDSNIPSNWSAYNGGSIELITDTTQTYNGSSGSMKCNYPHTGEIGGGVFAVGNYDLSPYCQLGATNHVYIDFYSKMPNSKQGVKFCKIFGQNIGVGVANTTFGTDYNDNTTRGTFEYAAFGDGTFTDTDTANGVWFDGTNNSANGGHGPGRSEGLPGYSVLTPQNVSWVRENWGTTWHRFQFYVKFNSGTTALNEIPDGETKVIIDGVTYVDAVGLFNRHYASGPMGSINLADYSQTGTAAFDVWYDSIRISQNGWTR